MEEDKKITMAWCRFDRALFLCALSSLLFYSGDGAGINNQNVGYFWHITDMHWDPTYSETSPGLSCNPGTVGDSFGRYGDYRCDPPWRLLEEAVWGMRAVRQDVDFLIWTGDDTPHIWNDTILHLEAVSDIVLRQSDLLQAVFPDKTVYSALGNHDWSPKNQVPPQPHPFYDVIAGKWQPWMDEAANTTFLKGGYYTMTLSPTVQMVILNTNLWYTSNALTEDMVDPADQFTWFDDVMTQAAQNGQKVVVLGHVPPGMFEKHPNKYWFYPDHNTRFLELLRRHAGAISGIHMAHHHTDSFRVLYDATDVPVSSLLLSPALSPWETTLEGTMGGLGNNPSVRLVEYDMSTGETLDVHQYYMNLTQANNQPNNFTWELLYSARDYYSLPDLSPASLHQLTVTMDTDDSLFSRYYSANGVLYDPEEKWTEEYRRVHLCAIRSLEYGAYQQCMSPGRAATVGGTRVLWLMVVVSVVVRMLV